MSTPKHHIHNVLNLLGTSIPDRPFDPRDAIIAAQDVALEMRDESDRAAVTQIVTLLRTRTKTLDNIIEAWQRSIKELTAAIKLIEDDQSTNPTKCQDDKRPEASKQRA
jgi:hypothetical protein